MPIHSSEPTPYPDVNLTLRRLLDNAQTLLGDHFIGLYLYGSLASGDFNPYSSDIDFVVVTRGRLPDDLLPALEEMHLELAGSDLKWATKLEGSYMPQAALRRYDPDAAPFPQINEGRFFVAGHGQDWVLQRHILREHEAIVAGPSIRTLIDPVSPDELRQAVAATLRDWWAPMLQDAGWLKRDEYQVFAVLTMCRVLYTLRHGAAVSKATAADWAQRTLGREWAGLIAAAGHWRRGDPFNRLPETVGLIGHTVASVLGSK